MDMYVWKWGCPNVTEIESLHSADFYEVNENNFTKHCVIGLRAFGCRPDEAFVVRIANKIYFTSKIQV